MADNRDPNLWESPRGCGSYISSVTFHLCFQIIITQIFLNLFIAIIIDAFMGVTEAYELPVSRSAMLEFEDIWSKEFDPEGSGFMKVDELDQLLLRLANAVYAKELLVVPDFIL